MIPDLGVPKENLGDDGKPNDIIPLTGSNVSREIVSKGPEIALTFVTDDLITNSGFKIYFEKGKLCKINSIDPLKYSFYTNAHIRIVKYTIFL